ncbi:hypothetical protein GCM10007276_13470 [Agaricicola taiwanensis]|uniref:Uncharacterized protein n=1 Tax=Agaricicola taiwanensis TaxID=591372 RepID=A0A8J2VLV9_9RHOB|nr:hypothetical protein GCM10007276_13470 [Agaricicola taiwanensis]
MPPTLYGAYGTGNEHTSRVASTVDSDVEVRRSLSQRMIETETEEPPVLDLRTRLLPHFSIALVVRIALDTSG